MENNCRELEGEAQASIARGEITEAIDIYTKLLSAFPDDEVR